MWSGVQWFDALLTSASPNPFADDPVILSFFPLSGGTGTVVTLTLDGGATGSTIVALGSIACVFTVVNDTTITVTVPADAVDAPWYVMTPTGVIASSTVYDVANVVGASTRTLRWALEVYPAPQPTGRTRVLLRESRNAVVVRDIIDAESDTYQTPSGVTYALKDAADTIAEGALAPTGDGWRGEIVLDPSIPLGDGAVLHITATLGAASWQREYPITITDQE